MYNIVEPRIENIKNEIERLLSLVQLEKNGRPIKVDGFRLRDLENWKTGYAQNIFDVLGPLSGKCNVECVFCMERSIPFERNNSFLSILEATTRLKYYSPKSQKCLFPSTRPHMETFFNKNAIEILKKARKSSPEELFIITTNGSTLTPDVVGQLSKIKPLLIKLSINSTDTQNRNFLMGLNNNKNKALECMKFLKDAGIPFTGSIVAWPGLGNKEIEKSIRDISLYDPYGIRVRLPLVHKYSPVLPETNLISFWKETSEFINSIKNDIDVPVWVEPVQYGRTPVISIIDGVINNSPAKRAGLMSGDQIVSIDGKKVSSRYEIRCLFGTDEFNSRDSIEIEIKRADKFITFRLDSSMNAGPTYPYNINLRHPGERFGILLLPDFDLGFLDNILRLTTKHSAKKILLFSSPLTAGTVEKLIGNLGPYKKYFEERDLWIYTIENSWMEGNTALLDSRFVEDYEKALLKLCTSLKVKPDLILIPDCFGSPWGTDFNGRSIFEIESKTNVPIELIPWHYIYGKED
jgi:hypothetical protein